MKTNFKLKAVALISALLMLLSAFCSFGILSARASYISEEDQQNYVFPESNWGNVFNADENLTSFYYFSDHAYSSTAYYSGYIMQCINANPYIENSELKYWSNSFWDEMKAYFDNYGGQNISNALIVFEARESFVYSYSMPNDPLPLYEDTNFGLMDRMFNTWQNNGCKIMFLDGLDEVCYKKNNFNEFLQYVDIHINLDLLTTFINTVFDGIAEKTQGVMNNIAVVFDKGMWAYNKIYRLLISMLVMLRNNTEKPDDVQVLLQNQVSVYFYDNGNYYDAENNPVEFDPDSETFWDSPIVDYNNNLEYDHHAEYVFIVGNSATYNDPNIQNLIEEVKNRRGEDRYETFEFVEYSQSYLNYYLSAIMWDFMLNDKASLNRYINRCGRCTVTFKPLFYGEGGKLREPNDRMDWLDVYGELPELEGDEGQVNNFIGFLVGGFV